MDQNMFTPEIRPDQPQHKINILLIVIVSLAVAAAAALPLTFYLMFFRDGALMRSIDSIFIDAGKVAEFENA